MFILSLQFDITLQVKNSHTGVKHTDFARRYVPTNLYAQGIIYSA